MSGFMWLFRVLFLSLVRYVVRYFFLSSWGRSFGVLGSSAFLQLGCYVCVWVSFARSSVRYVCISFGISVVRSPVMSLCSSVSLYRCRYFFIALVRCVAAA